MGMFTGISALSIVEVFYWLAIGTLHLVVTKMQSKR